MIRVITISREYGSGGSAIAQILAGRLGWKIIDDPLIARVAASASASPDAVKSCEETVVPWFHRILKAIWRGGFAGGLSLPESDPLDADAVADLWNRVIREGAEAGECVAVGRGGQCLLKGRPDAFHVQVYAPFAAKIARLQAREPAGTDLRAAAAERDRRRAAYIRHYFGEDWRNPHLYDLMLCSIMGLERAADVILLAAGLAVR